MLTTCAVNAQPEADYEYIVIIYAQGNDVEQKKYVETIERIKQIEKKVRIRVINKNIPANALQTQLFNIGVQCIISLGPVAYSILNDMSHKHKFDIVYGFIDEAPTKSSDIFGVSLSPNPSALFDQLIHLDSQRKTVHVIYLKNRDEELIDVARLAANKKGLTLNAVAAQSMSDMAVKYQTLMSDIDVAKDALWLLSGNDMDSSIVNAVMAQAWEKKIFVFSSDDDDVNRGVIFSVTQSNYALGDKLSALMNSLLYKPKQQPFITFTESVKPHYNILTARHLKIELPKALSQHKAADSALKNAQ